MQPSTPDGDYDGANNAYGRMLEALAGMDDDVGVYLIRSDGEPEASSGRAEEAAPAPVTRTLGSSAFDARKRRNPTDFRGDRERAEALQIASAQPPGRSCGSSRACDSAASRRTPLGAPTDRP